ncbi:PAS domain S-box protein [Lujinxingia sediminis]|uniref:histidine kinase n=1 Tax=Lujinxingia sediminis TaxID=2480984 RepID=A0ABY0CPU0_9DELT|nr:ATP-binding protein [Lujinxingia sediminis]RVU42496.1 PAS domain S-box protein [Lujinxingia sediminis]
MSARKHPDTDASEAADPTCASTILAALPDLVLELDSRATIRAHHTGSPTAVLADPPETLQDHTLRDLLPRATADRLQSALTDALTLQQNVTLECFIPHEQNLASIEARIAPISTERALIILRDVTAAFRERNNLRQSEQRFRALVENLPGVVYRCRMDEDWSAIFISERIEELVGLPAIDFTEQRTSLEQVTHPEDRSDIRSEITSAVARHEPFDLHYRMIHADGSIRHIWERGRAVYAGVDQITYLDGAIFDVTDLHRLRQRVLTSSKMAAVGSLAAGVAHEINNPLAIVLANLEFVTEELVAIHQAYAADHVVTEAVDDIQQAIIKVQTGIDRVRSIIDDLRSFSDAAQSRAEHLDMARLTSWALRRAEPRVLPVARLITHIDDVPQVWASEIGVVQTIWNLIDNAADAVSDLSPENARIDVTLKLSDREDCVLLEIRDNGRGMGEDVLARAFEPFFTTQGIGDGAGLGLFVCQGLVAGMGGDISVESTPGQGTRVRVFLPTAPAQ